MRIILLRKKPRQDVFMAWSGIGVGPRIKIVVNVFPDVGMGCYLGV